MFIKKIHTKNNPGLQILCNQNFKREKIGAVEIAFKISVKEGMISDTGLDWPDMYDMFLMHYSLICNLIITGNYGYNND